jgi:uncharacterized membrane protein
MEMVIPLPEDTRIKKIYSAFFRQEFPADLTLVVVWLAAGIVAIYLPILNQTPVLVVFALPVVLFIPGYCLIAALFPKNDDIGLSERIALSIGLSIAIIPLIGLGLNFTPWGIRLDSVVISVTVFTWVLVLVAHYRRALLPFGERFSMPFSEIASTIREGFFPAGSSRVDRLLTVVLSLTILIAVLATVYVIAVPKEGERFTEFFILGEKQKAADYPDQIIAGLHYPMFIGVGNHEYRNITYTIETWLLRTEFDNVTNTSQIIAMEPNDHLSFTLTDNETTIIPYNLSVKKTGFNRVEFLLFNETVPGPDVTGSDRINASYRDLYLRVTVRDAEYQEPSI